MSKTAPQTLPAEVFAQLGPYRLVPAQDPPGHWAIPGGWIATTGQLYQLAVRNRWTIRIHS
jgi:ADP-ribose pyrophosphatase YjhB (NUDIX family)